jgi:hypothetical protein
MAILNASREMMQNKIINMASNKAFTFAERHATLSLK